MVNQTETETESANLLNSIKSNRIGKNVKQLLSNNNGEIKMIINLLNCSLLEERNDRTHARYVNVNLYTSNKLLSVMGRDDSWPTMVLSVVPSYTRAISNLIGPAQSGFPMSRFSLYR